MQEQYSEAHIRMKAIVQTATDGIITIDSIGKMEIVNPAAAKLFGYTVGEMIGQNINMLMPEPFRSGHDGYIRNYLRTGEAKIIGIGREVAGMRKDGSIFPCRLSISQVNLEDRKLFTGIVHDLSEQKAAEEALKLEKERTHQLNTQLEERVERRTEELANAVNQLLNINKKLEHEVSVRKSTEEALRKSEKELRKALETEKELNQLKSRFVSMASHEFRTPLSTILSSADLIEVYTKDTQQEKREKHTNRIKSAVSNLTSILNDFLSLGKLEEGKIEVKTVEFNLNRFCTEVIDEFRSLLKPGQELIHKTPTADIWITLDKKLIRNILNNLISNAIKYSPEGKNIYCFIEVDEQAMSLEVKDEGIGIPEEEQQHLFTRFFRAHNVENIQGTGLGLNIVKRYVDLLDGAITFESKLNKGTTFSIQIPLKN